MFIVNWSRTLWRRRWSCCSRTSPVSLVLPVRTVQITCKLQCTQKGNHYINSYLFRRFSKYRSESIHVFRRKCTVTLFNAGSYVNSAIWMELNSMPFTSIPPPLPTWPHLTPPHPPHQHPPSQPSLCQRVCQSTAQAQATRNRLKRLKPGFRIVVRIAPVFSDIF